MYWIAPCFTALCCTELYLTVLYKLSVMCCYVVFCFVPCCIVLCCIFLHCSMHGNSSSVSRVYVGVAGVVSMVCIAWYCSTCMSMDVDVDMDIDVCLSRSQVCRHRGREPAQAGHRRGPHERPGPGGGEDKALHGPAPSPPRRAAPPSRAFSGERVALHATRPCRPAPLLAKQIPSSSTRDPRADFPGTPAGRRRSAPR